MVKALEFIFEDFWRFLGTCCLLMIVALWKPIEINIIHGDILEDDKHED